ncbi:MAG: hypothetical protein ACI9HK_002644, partial [Pirellulaceae bacterium]
VEDRRITNQDDGAGNCSGASATNDGRCLYSTGGSTNNASTNNASTNNASTNNASTNNASVRAYYKYALA